MVMLIWFSFAEPTILDDSYPTQSDNTVQMENDTHFVAAWGEASDTEDANIENNEQPVLTRTVIPAVPKTGPSGNIVWIIIATLVVFGGYIYIKKRADI